MSCHGFQLFVTSTPVRAMFPVVVSMIIHQHNDVDESHMVNYYT